MFRRTNKSPIVNVIANYYVHSFVLLSPLLLWKGILSVQGVSLFRGSTLMAVLRMCDKLARLELYSSSVLLLP